MFISSFVAETSAFKSNGEDMYQCNDVVDITDKEGDVITLGFDHEKGVRIYLKFQLSDLVAKAGAYGQDDV